MISVDWQNIVASADLSNIHHQAKSKRFGNWCVSFNGLVIYCHDLLSFYMAAKDIFLRQIYKFSPMLAAPRIIDGGGHIGLFSLYAKQHFPQARIKVFEPDSDSLELLKLNLKANDVTDVEIIEAGLYSEEGIFSFAGGQSDGSTIFSEETNTTIRTVKLSNHICDEIDFLKLNIEGAELDVLKEIQLRLQFVKELVIEYHGFPEIGQNLHRILDILDSTGFRYLIHDFDAETNPATKPPFYIEPSSQYFLLIYARRLFEAKRSSDVHHNSCLASIQNLGKTLRDMPHNEAASINDYLKATSYFGRSSISLAHPSVWEIETTNRCAMTCSHCPRSTCMKRPVIDMDYELLTKLLEQLLPQTQDLYHDGHALVNYIHYGEPALYKWYGESISYAKSKGFKVVISSTSSAFNDNAVLASVNYQLDELWLIFDGMDDGAFKEIRGKAASFDKGLLQMNKLIAQKKQQLSDLPRVSVVMIKHPANRHQWQTFKDFFGRMPQVTTNLAHFSTFAGNCPPINALQQAIADDPEEQQEMRRVAELNKHICYYPWHSVSVLADGRVVPCCRDVNGDYVLGDLNNESLIEIWNGERMRQLRNDFIQGNRNNPLCKSCKEGSLEIGVPLPPDPQAAALLARYSISPTGLDYKNDGIPTTGGSGMRNDARHEAEKDTMKPDFGDLNSLQPISRVFGGDRMTDASLPLCWFYIRRFLANHAGDVAGRVLEIGDDTYTRMFGGERVRQSDILHVQPGSPVATIIADLTKADNIPSDTFDCIICTQTIHCIYDTRAVLANLYRILKPGGVLLASLPGISQISRYDMDRWGDYWRFTTASAERLFGELWPEECLEIKAFGNVQTSVAYLHGLVSGDLPEGALDYDDDDYQMMICVRAEKPLQTVKQEVSSESDNVRLIAGGWDNYARSWDGGSFSVISGHSVDFIGDEWTAEDVSGGGTNYGLDDDTARDFRQYLTRNLLDPYLPGFADVGLEIGPGGGRVTELLRKRTGLLHLADASEAMLAKLKERFAGDGSLTYHFTDGMNLPGLAAESLDYVLAFDVFVHFEPRLVFWYLRQIAGLLKPGGTGIIHYANLTSPIGWRQFEADLEMNVRQRAHFASFGTMSPEIMQTFLSSLGLEIVTTDTRLIPRDAVAVFKKPGPVCEAPLKRTGTGQDPVVLIYHRVADLALDPQLLCVSPENFDQHLRILAGNFRVIPLHQLLDECRRGVVTPDTVALTFDDGYLDNLTNALPFLEKHDIHATIFPTVGMVGSDEEFWWDALERIFLTGNPLPGTLSVTTPGGEKRWDLTSARGRAEAYEDICGVIHSDPPEEVSKTVDDLLSWSGLPKTARKTHRVVNQEQLRLLAASPCIEIGSHGMNHSSLGSLPADRQRMEIRQSKQLLETIIGKPVRIFSYPFGSSSDFSRETGEILATEGYVAGIANIQGSIRNPRDLFSVPRRLVRNWPGRIFDTWMKNDDKDQLEAETVASRKRAIINNMREFR